MDDGAVRPVLLIESRHRSCVFFDHQLLHGFLRLRARYPDYLALAGKAESRRHAPSSALLPAKSCRSDALSKSFMTTSINRNAAEICAGSHVQPLQDAAEALPGRRAVAAIRLMPAETVTTLFAFLPYGSRSRRTLVLQIEDA